MKIVFFSNSSWSIYNFRRNLIKRLIESGKSIYVLCPKDKQTKKLIRLGCKFVDINIQNNNINPIYDFILLKNLMSILSEIKPDYILNFTIKPLIYGTFIAGFLKIKSISMITGLGTVFIKKNFITLIVIFLYRIAFTKAYRVIFQNKDDRRKFINLKIVKPIKCILSPGSGVDLDHFKYEKNYFTSKTNFLLSGRLLKEKGVYEFIEAVKKVNLETTKCKFKIVGSIDEKNPSSIKKSLIKNFMRDKNNSFENFSEDIRKFIVWSNCVILPSYREGTPRGLLEAMSMGRPIITTNAVGCKEVIVNNKNGFKTKIKDISSLYLAIKKFHNLSLSDKIKMSKYSRKFVSNKFDEKRVISIYERIIK